MVITYKIQNYAFFVLTIRDYRFIINLQFRN
nr:MAG TPA: hypothetical protein [Bacteriophage sp.]